jgi:hypothetical protein
MKIEEQDGRAKREDVCPSQRGKLDLDTLRAQIETANEKAVPEYWRSLEELAGSPAFQEALHRAYDGPGYEHFIYSGEPEPSLPANDAAWARQFVPGAP